MSKQNRKRKQMVKEYKIGDSNKPILYTYFSNLCGLGLEYSAERFLVDYEGLHKGDAITPFLNYTCWPLPVRYDGENFPIAFTFFSNGKGTCLRALDYDLEVALLEKPKPFFGLKIDEVTSIATIHAGCGSFILPEEPQFQNMRNYPIVVSLNDLEFLSICDINTMENMYNEDKRAERESLISDLKNHTSINTQAQLVPAEEFFERYGYNDPMRGSSIVGETLSSGFTQKPEGHGQKVFK